MLGAHGMGVLGDVVEFVWWIGVGGMLVGLWDEGILRDPGGLLCLVRFVGAGRFVGFSVA